MAVAVPIWVAPSNTSTVLPATAVPASVIWLALVMPSPAVPLSGENEAIVGAAGRAAVTNVELATTPSANWKFSTLVMVSVTIRRAARWSATVKVCVAEL